MKIRRDVRGEEKKTNSDSMYADNKINKIYARETRREAEWLKRTDSLTFRVSCLEPVLDGGNSPLIAERVIPAGGEEKLFSHTTLCAHGHGMTLKEMNENLLKRGLPYIKIGYCKYCYNHNTIGVLDEGDKAISKLFGGGIVGPRFTESGLYEFIKIPRKYLKNIATPL